MRDEKDIELVRDQALKASFRQAVQKQERCKRCGEIAKHVKDTSYVLPDISGPYCCLDCFREEYELRKGVPPNPR